MVPNIFLPSFCLQFFCCIRSSPFPAPFLPFEHPSAAFFFFILWWQFLRVKLSALSCFFQTMLDDDVTVRPHTLLCAFRLIFCLTLSTLIISIVNICAHLPFFTYHRRPGRVSWVLPFLFSPNLLAASFLFSGVIIQWDDPATFHKPSSIGSCSSTLLKFSLITLFLFPSFAFHIQQVAFLSWRFFRSFLCQLAFQLSKLPPSKA